METNKTTKTDIYNIDPRNIVVVEGFNSRIDFGDINELADQIKEQGLLNPITVKPFKDEHGTEKYRLVDGERRYRAIMLNIQNGVDIARVKALFVSKSTTEEEMLVQQMMRNEGKPFTEYELGILCAKLRDKCGKTTSEIAKMLGKNPGCISYALSNLELDERVQDLLRENKICGPDVRRVYKACKEKYGEDKYEEMAVAEILNLKKKAEKDAAINDTKASKVSVKNSDLLMERKDTNKVKDGFATLMRYIDMYSEESGIEFELDIMDLYNTLKTNPQMTLNDYFMKIKKSIV